MSIYASAWSTDAGHHAARCGRWAPVEHGQEPEDAALAWWADGSLSRLDDTRPCTCSAGPVGYQGSHILPSADDARAGSVDVAEIPGWIHRVGRPALDPEETGEAVWPWLRLWVESAGWDLGPPNVVVLLDRAHVAGLHAYLGRWLDRAVPDPPSRGEATGGG
jgi:hypothetical protein